MSLITHRSTIRSLIGVSLTAALTAMMLAVTALPASAHTKLSPRAYCSGIELSPHRDALGGAISIFISYSSANGGTNCAWAQKNVNRDKSEPLTLFLGVCPTGDPRNPCEPIGKSDFGNFRYYAGPVEINDTAGRCIMVSVRYHGYTEDFGPMHCG
ncbi:Secreted protein [Nocardiopsis gilva]